VLNRIVKYLTTNLFLSLFTNKHNLSKTKKINNNFTKKNLNKVPFFEGLNLKSYGNLYVFSKSLSSSKFNINSILPFNPYFFKNNFLINLLITYNNQNHTNLNVPKINTKFISSTEVNYLYNNFLPKNLKHSTKNINLNLNLLYKFYTHNYFPIVFNFNLENNNINSKQSRWLVRNSLLGDSFITNSFLFTQSKKLIGLSTFGKEFSKDTLWLPTKTSKQSSLESSHHLNNLNSFLKYNYTNYNLNFLTNNKIRHSSLNYLNFFENSRL
jgi:hypothetical protein